MVKTIKFEDYPDFRPNLTPREIFLLGSFGGTYWRPIKSAITGKNHKNRHKKYPKSWWQNINNKYLTTDYTKYDKKLNKYGVKVGSTLEFWEDKGWITKRDPYGWIEWYCNFYNGRRSKDDEWQIKRWKNIASETGRFRKWLIKQIKNKKGKLNDYTISPAIRQTLQHWGYQLTKGDLNKK